MRSAMLPVWRKIALCFFVDLDFIVISLIKLLQKSISIIRRSVSAAISFKLPPVQAWSKKVATTTVSVSPVHLTTMVRF